MYVDLARGRREAVLDGVHVDAVAFALHNDAVDADELFADGVELLIGAEGFASTVVRGGRRLTR